MDCCLARKTAEARTQGYPISDRPCLRDVLVTVGHQPVRREGSAPEGVTFPRIVGTAHLTMAAMATLPIMNDITLVHGAVGRPRADIAKAVQTRIECTGPPHPAAD